MQGTISKYTQAAYDKVNELKPTLIGAKEPDAKESRLEETKQQMTEVAEKIHHDTNVVRKAKEETSDGSTKLFAAGGDDVMKVLSDGTSTQEDSLKANLRVATEALSQLMKNLWDWDRRGGGFALTRAAFTVNEGN